MKRREAIIISYIFFCLAPLEAQTDKTITKDSPYTGTPPSEEIARDWIKLSQGFSHHIDDGAIAFKLDKSLVLDVDPNDYIEQIIIDNYSINREGVYRGLVGNLGISPMGGATYSVPIQIPAGFAGLEPNLALVYNSMGGIGPCGKGWNISGLSSISRTTPTIYHDNERNELQFNSEDEFILDGQRLIRHSSGSDPSGNLKITFYSEKYDGSVIEAFTSSSADPGYIDHFEITQVKGTKYIYDWEFTSNGGKTFSWHLSMIEDLNGNKMTVQYGGKTSAGPGDPVGLIHPIILEYNKNGEEEASSKVWFIYENGVVGNKYLAGESYETGRILREIEVIEEEKVYRKYNIVYENIDNRYDRIVKVSIQNGAGEELNPLLFNYGEIGEISRTNVTFDQSGNNGTKIYGQAIRKNLDYNGDGIKDMMVVDTKSSTTKILFGLIKFETKIVDLHFFNGYIDYNEDYQFQFDFSEMGISSNWKNSNFVHDRAFRPIDIDGDGDDEVLMSEYIEDGGSNYLKLRLLSPSSLSSIGEICRINYSYLPEINTGDINGDGQVDIIVTNPEGEIEGSPATYVHDIRILLNNGTYPFSDLGITSLDAFDDLSEASKFISADLNNDGRTDLMLVNENGYNIHFSKSNLQGDNTIFESGNGIGSNIIKTDFTSRTDRNLAQGDFNGDGLVDFLINSNEDDWSLCINKGNGFFSSSQLSIPAFNRLNYDSDPSDNETHKWGELDDAFDQCYVADYNADGKSDVVIVDGILHVESRDSIGEDNFEDTIWESKYARSGSKIYIYISNENDILELVTSYDHNTTSKRIKHPFSTQFHIGDYNLDGITDLLWHTGEVDGNASQFQDEYYIFSVNGASSANKIEKIVDGLGNKSIITYGFLFDGGEVYEKTSSTDSEPYLFQLAGPVPVVKTLSINYDESYSLSANYSYKGAMIHAQGKGFLGFDKMVTEHSMTGIKTETEVNTWDATTYSPDMVTYKVYKTDGSTDYLLSTDIKNLDQTEKGTNTDSYIYTISSQSQTDNLKGVTVSTTNTYSDIYLTTKVVSPGGGYTTTTDYDINSYVLGVPTQIEVTTKVPDDDNNYSTQSTLSIDATTGNLTQKIENSNLAAEYQIKTEYNDYNTVGNPEKIEASSGTLPVQTSTFSYGNGGRTMTYKTTDLGTTQYNYNDFRQPRVIISPYGEETTIGYDNWGSKITSTSPLGETITSSVKWAEGAVVGAEYYTESTSSFNTSGYSRVYYNAMGQEISTESTGYSNAEMISSKTYNPDGTLEEEVIPYYSTGGTAQTIGYSYDIYGRLEETTYPSGKTVTATYDGTDISYETVAGAKTLTSEQEYNLDGSLKSSTDPMNKKIGYTYYSHGNIETITDPGDNVISTTYDPLLYQMGLDDLDAGDLSYEYNSYGQLKEQTNGNNEAVNMVYDDQGRLTSSTETDLSHSLNYYASGNGKDLLHYEQAGNGTRYEYSNDDKRRLSELITEIDATHEYTEEFQYGSKREMVKRSLNDQVELTYTYTADGTLKKIVLDDSENSVSETIWQITTHSPTRLDVLLGNGNTEERTYDDYGLPAKVNVNNTFEYDFEWNEMLGQLDSRTQKVYNSSGVLVNTLEEEFNYDDLNRLTTRDVSSDGEGADVSYKNDGIGLIDVKSDVGQYNYAGTNSPHRLGFILNPTADYTFKPSYEISYTSFDKVKEIEQGTEKKIVFTYGPDQTRKKMEYFENSSLVYTRYYSGSYERTEYVAGDIKENYYIEGVNGLAAIYHIDNGTGVIYYVHTDYLGSVLSLTDENGDLVAGNQFSFDAWGRRRDISWEFTDLSTEPITDRGFTGHEHIDEFNLINMNGRVYDPLTAQFLSPDNFIQSPTNSQNLNRYTYCLNNPLIYTDPSGEIVWAPIIIAAAISGTVNLTMNTPNIDNGWDAVGYFAIGAAAGAVGGIAGQAVAGAVGTVGFAGGAMTGGAAGFSGGFVSGAGNSWMGGANYGDGLVYGLKTGAIGGLTGGVIGGISGGITATGQGGNFWSGKGARLDVLDPLTGEIKVGEGMEFSNEYAGDFSSENYPDAKGIDNLFSDNSLPEGYGYELKGDIVYNSDGGRVAGTTVYNGTGKGSNVYLYKASFTSKERLYLNMGHEYIHAAHFKAFGSLARINSSEEAAYRWTTAQSNMFGYSGTKAYYTKWQEYLPYANSKYHFSRFGFYILSAKPW